MLLARTSVGFSLSLNWAVLGAFASVIVDDYVTYGYEIGWKVCMYLYVRTGFKLCSAINDGCVWVLVNGEGAALNGESSESNV